MSKAKPTQPPTPAPETDLPEGWAMATLGQLTSPSKEKVEPDDRPDAPYLSLEHIESGTGRILGQGVGSDVGSTKAVFRAGDVLYGKLRPYLNKVCIPDFDGICSTDILVFPQSEFVDSRYLLSLLMQPSVVEFANHNMSGVQLPRIRFDKLAGLEMPLAPLPEQKRIVAKVEALLERVNAARARLARLPAILKRFRQSILAAACSGQLTAEWREDTASPATGAELLQQIAQERQAAQADSRRSRRHDSDEADSSGAVPVTWEVPDTWEWATISDLLHYERSAAYGVLQPGADLPKGVPFVRVCDLANGTVDTSQIKKIAPEIDKQYPRTRLQGDEVLVSLVGTIGRIAVAPKAVAGANVARAIGMLPLCPHVLPQFLRFALENPAKNTELVDLAREVARKTLNLGLLKAVTVPLPPEAEQREIVRRVEELFALADGIEAHVRAATVRAERMPQAILARAFRGELVPTEADLARAEGRNYEPASVLLERIQETRKQHKPASRKRGRKGKNMTQRSAVEGTAS